MPLLGIEQHKSYNPGEFKYVVVPLAMMEGMASSGRLLWLLAYSGAVVLMQEGIPTFHITSRLQPWVHYVPLSFSGADLAMKVKWLQLHDDMAKQIATNGRNFGRSYLRLEDYFCYSAKMLMELGHVLNGSDVLTPFDPIDVFHVRPLLLKENPQWS
jgi:hypothetical protein